jgi:pimeloyl-ACP methyl ester carboxylesterase
MTETLYASTGEVSIAYRVYGAGPIDILVVPGIVSNVEAFDDLPGYRRFLDELGRWARVITFDKRGNGLSDRVAEPPSLEERMDDVRAVLDAVGSERAALFGYSEGGGMCALFAATYPARTSGLIMYGSYARLKPAHDHPWARSAEVQARWLETIQRDWGGPVGLDIRAPSQLADDSVRQWWARFLRMGASPAAAAELSRMSYEIDIRHLLPAVRVPTLVLHTSSDRTVDIGASRYIAERIPGAKFVELAGVDHLPWGDGADRIVDEIEEFLTGVRHGAELDRVLATVLFTDIVGATEKAASLGDRRWRDLLEGHHRLVRQELGRFRGREIDTAGDGFLATFDGPARGVRCARAVSEGVHALGLEVRAGLHTGEVEVLDDKVAGLAVHIGARVAAAAGPGELLVSSTVKDLVAGSGLRFQDRGLQPLKGVPGEWHLFALEPEGRRA